jgi:hypothetical protein
MNTRLTLLIIMALSLPPALVAPSGALAQAKDEATSPPTAGSGREVIMNKLERIRLDTVRYDGLPLGEVVIHLRDEARKRDPEKKGINFLINQNLDPGEATAPPAPMLGPDGTPLPPAPVEAVDVGATAIKINPPLNDVRLVDVLEAVVKVADHPIKYSVEDYGVVFSPRGSAPAHKQKTPTASSGLQVISNKLERIRLDTVRYDGLPLGEVVINLLEESKKRDPEKKGINFLINQNLDPGEATAIPTVILGPNGNPVPSPPAESVDVGSIAIKINPPLNDVRLVDVLDAVVKVADRPIKYSVEDYGVVFSPRGAEPGRKEEIGFTFPGGTPSQFLNAVQEQYKVDWLSVADIPKEMADVHIPRLRLNRGSLGLAPGDPRASELGVMGLISLYNQLGEQKPELGRLIVRDEVTKPSVVMFVPEKGMADTQPKIKVKAFSIYGISDAEKANLQEDINQAKQEAIQYASRLRGSPGTRNLEGSVAIHDATSLLVATGPESFVDMVESIVAARAAKGQARNPGAPAPSVPSK